MSNRGCPRRSPPGPPRQGQEGGETGAAPARGWEATADLFIDAAAQTAPARGWEATVERREAEHETGTAPADRPQDFPATGRREVKPEPPPPAGWRQPPPPAGGRQPWDGGKRNMKPRPPLLRRKRRLWTFLVRPGRSRFHSAPETARQGRPRFQPAPKTARHGRPRFQPAPKTARQGRPGFHTQLLEHRSGRAGPTQRPHSAARSARAPPSPRGPITRHAHCP